MMFMQRHALCEVSEAGWAMLGLVTIAIVRQEEHLLLRITRNGSNDPGRYSISTKILYTFPA